MNTERSKPCPPQKGQKSVNGNGRKVTPATLIPVGAALTILIALIAGYQWLDERLDAQDTSIGALAYELREVKTLTKDRWRGSDMKLWTEMFLRLNPEHKDKVPDPWVILDQRQDRK